MGIKTAFYPQTLDVEKIEQRIRQSGAFVFILDYYGKEIVKKNIKDKIKINGTVFRSLKHSLDITASLTYFGINPKRERAKAKLIEIIGEPSFIKMPNGYGYDNSFILRYDFENKDTGLLERTFIEYSGDEAR